MKKILIVVSIIVLISSNITAGPILLFDSYNARSYSLSQADAATTRGLDSLLSNPAGLAGLKSISGSVFYLPWFGEMNSFSLSAGYPLVFGGKFYGTAAINLTTFSIDPFLNYDQAGNKLDDLSANDFLFGLGYGYPVMDTLYGGLNIKFFNTSLGKETASAIAFDLGVMKMLSISGIQKKKVSNNLTIGLSLQNIGSSQEYIDESSPLPVKLRMGISYLFYNSKALGTILLIEGNSTKKQDIKISSGLEARIASIFFIRTGYKIIADSAIAFTAGGGLHYNISGSDLAFDYSMIPLGELGIHHAFSLKFSFGNIEEKLKLQRFLKEMESALKAQEYDNALKASKRVILLDQSNKEAHSCRNKVAEEYKKHAEEEKAGYRFEKSHQYWKKYLDIRLEDKHAFSETVLLQDIINDVTPPEVALDQFKEEGPITVHEKSLSMTGIITDSIELKKITINDQELEVTGKESIRIEKSIELHEGENSIKVYAEDIRGNKIEKLFKVIYQQESKLPAQPEPDTNSITPESSSEPEDSITPESSSEPEDSMTPESSSESE